MASAARVALFAPLPPELLSAQIDGLDVVTPEAAGSAVAAARGAVIAVADYSGQRRIDAEVVAALAPTCRLIQIPAAGTDSVDVDACRAAGVPVAACAGLNAEAVAEWCVWGALDALRQLSRSTFALRDGRWEQLGQVRYELGGKTVGIVGLGRIGQAAARRFAGFGVDLAYTSRRRRDPDTEADLDLRWLELDDLVTAADVLVLTCALTEDTRGLLSAERIASMKPTAVVVNAARGEVTDEAALAGALADERLHGAAIDAFAVEPLPAGHPLRGPDRATLTPHVGGVSAESVGRILQRSVDNVRAVLDGGEIRGLV